LPELSEIIKKEGDLIVERGGELMPIEVKAFLKNGNIGASLAGFINRYNPQKALVVNLDYQGRRMVGETEVIFILPFELENFLD
jgi:hypothetical protein